MIFVNAIDIIKASQNKKKSARIILLKHPKV